MALPPLVLLPGLDGTAALFGPLLDLVDAEAQAIAINEAPGDHAGLDAWLRPRLPDHPFLLVAESFSGPLAVRIAADPPEGLLGLVLVASFVLPPVRAPAHLVRPLLLQAQPSACLAAVRRWWQTG